MERQKERTRKVTKTVNPQWHERFSFYVSETYATVDVCVFDTHLLTKDEFMGASRAAFVRAL